MTQVLYFTIPEQCVILRRITGQNDPTNATACLLLFHEEKCGPNTDNW